MELNPERVIHAEILIPASRPRVWKAWTTEAGAKTFFAPDCRIELEPGGAYEMYFAPDSPPGQRGGEGCRVMAVQPDEMLSFSWNNPPSLPQVRSQFTHVVVRLISEGSHTIVRLQHDGWGQGGVWEQAINYFDAAWKRVVLPRLSYRFVHGPIDWDNVPDLAQA